MWLRRIRRSVKLNLDEDARSVKDETKPVRLAPDAVDSSRVSRGQRAIDVEGASAALAAGVAVDVQHGEVRAGEGGMSEGGVTVHHHHHHHHFYLHGQGGGGGPPGGGSKGALAEDGDGSSRGTANARSGLRLPLIDISGTNTQDNDEFLKVDSSQRSSNRIANRVGFSAYGSGGVFSGASNDMLPPIPKNADGRLVTLRPPEHTISRGSSTSRELCTPMAYKVDMWDDEEDVTTRLEGSRRKHHYPKRGQTRERFLRNLRHVHHSNNLSPMLRFYSKTFSSFSKLIELFKADPESSEADFEAWHPSLREDILDAVHETLMQTPHLTHKIVLKSIIIALLKEHELHPADEVRALFILIQNPVFAAQSSYTVYAHLLKKIVNISNVNHQLLIRWFRGMEAEKLRRIVRNTIQFINVRQFPPSLRHHLPSQSSSRWWIPTAAKVLALINASNELTTPSPCYPTSDSLAGATIPPPPPPLHYTELYNSALDHIDLMKDFSVWQNSSNTGQFSYCQQPFLLSIVAKRTILAKDSEQQMIQTARRSIEAKGAFYRYRYRYRPQMELFFLNIRVRRSHLVSDSLNEISNKKQDLKKKLKVSFIGEPGLDMGGLAKEWLLLLIRHIFEPDYGMFVYHPNSRCYWFSTCARMITEDLPGNEVKRGGERKRHGSGYSNSSTSSSGSGSPIGSESASRASSYESHILSQSKNLREYNLIGVLMGLAVYNSITLDLHFPLICYRKLLMPPVAPWSSNSNDQCRDEQDEFLYETEGETSDEDNSDGSDEDPIMSHHVKLLSSFSFSDDSREGSATGHQTRADQVGLVEAPSIEALAEIMPDVARGLNELLAYEGNVEEDMCMNFQVSLEEYGEVRTYDIKEGGADTPVTNENRHEYVALYLDWILNSAIYHQFRAFYHGFHSVCDSKALLLLSPEEVEMLVCGSPTINLRELQKVTEYDGYNGDEQVIRDFWEVLESLPLDLQKKFLHFTTGSDRIPVGGMSEMPFKITRLPSVPSNSSSHHRRRMGGWNSRSSAISTPLSDQDEPLPEAHTCFNQLVLPPYKSQETLRQKLTIAISNAEGFGLE
ncbi:probable E3 ubiquitin-protein ligase HECTD2 [Ischnura elegans]|uniref:probable E3 ubiquitin-protein ligase HECTD2 n=1 Tax=Ischnura elegans TaxID=197161 RepID=UPI001ED86FE6|nr:probable E3 ubiquitin-protein ligase HECTD2 [Ischnura elegans]